jgi:hypothetical protein
MDFTAELNHLVDRLLAGEAIHEFLNKADKPLLCFARS